MNERGFNRQDMKNMSATAYAARAGLSHLLIELLKADAIDFR